MQLSMPVQRPPAHPQSHPHRNPRSPRPQAIDVSLASSPRSSALPSPPDSPSSVSSLPSVSSSFFFSSAAASPGHPLASSQPYLQSHPHSSNGASNDAFIIPSLVLPAALRRPTPYGQTIGDLRLIVVGSGDAGSQFLDNLLLDDNEHIVELGHWEDFNDTVDAGAPEKYKGVKILRASTDWIEHRDPHGLEKFEPLRNLEIVEVSGYGPTSTSQSDVHHLLAKIKSIIHAPFCSVANVLHPDHRPSPIIANLVSSAFSPLYTALILLLPSAPSQTDRFILNSLGAEIPIIVLPRLSNYSHLRHGVSTREPDDFQGTRLSIFQPSSAVALRTGLFNSPETLSLLRSEAADRFLRWREVEREVENINTAANNQGTLVSGSRAVILSKSKARISQTHNPLIASAKLKRQPLPRWPQKDVGTWDKARWEAEWESNLSLDVARRLQEGKITQSKVAQSKSSELIHCDVAERDYYDSNKTLRLPMTKYDLTQAPAKLDYDYDPLHLPSLLMLSLSLLGPLHSRLSQTFVNLVTKTFGRRVVEDASDLSSAVTLKANSRRSRMRMRRSIYGDEKRVNKPSTVGLTLIGCTFCVGVGVGMLLK